MTPRRYKLSLLAIVAVGMFGRLFHFNLATNSDEQHYIVFARQLSGSVAVPVRFEFTGRLVWGWTLSLWGRLWSLNLEWTSVLMFIFAAASIMLVATMAKRAFGPGAALLAAGIQASYFINLRYDVMTAPDSMATPVMLASVLLFLEFLERGGVGRLIICGALIGALVGIKNYYTLIAIPFTFCLLLRPAPALPFRQVIWMRIRQVAILGLASIATAAVSLYLSYAAFGDALWQFHGVGSGLRDSNSSEPTGLASVLAFLGGRFKYFYYLLAEHGVVGGVVLLGGAVYLGSLAWKRLDCRVLFMIPMMFLLFLSLMFLSVRPLRFVAQEPRYVLAISPFLAIGAGGAAAAVWDRLRADAALRRCFCVLVAAIAAINLWLPNYRNTTTPVATALRAAISQSKKADAAFLVLPWYYRWSAPDGPTLRGIDIRYSEPDADYAERVDRAMPLGRFDYMYGQIDSVLKDQRPVAVYVPEDMSDDPSVKTLATSGFRKIDMLGSTTSIRTWLGFFGLGRGDTHCGWLYVRK